MKTLVAYYSKNGNNDYLAHRLAKDIQGDIELIKPRINLFFFFLMDIGFGVKKFKSDVSSYEKVVLLGPIWVGRFVRPLKDFLSRYLSKINKLYFVTCCGSSYEKKRDKFGHELVFDVVKEKAGDKMIGATALPIMLVIPEDKKEDSEYVMKTRLSDDNFTGEIKENYDKLIAQLKSE